MISSSRNLSHLLFFAVLFGCGSGDVVSVGVADGEALSLGNGQIASAGNLLPVPLGVRVYDSGGDPRPGVMVRWKPRERHGSVSPAVSTTDAAGEAFTSWTLGTGSGLQETVAEVEGIPPIRLQARALAGPASRLRIVTPDGDGPRIEVGRTATFGTEIEDAYGNPILDRTVIWSSPDSSFLRVNDAGIATGVAPGGARIVASLEGVADSVEVTVVDGVSQDWISVDAGGSGATAFSCAVAANGQGYCWGNNFSGQLGRGTIVSTPLQAPVQGGHRFEEIRTGAGNSTFACGRTGTGEALCWGSAGRSGIGVTSPGSSLSPLTVALPPDPVVVTLDVGTSHACVVLEEGLAFCWGAGGAGQLGSGTLVDSATPVEVRLPAGIRLTSVAAGSISTCGAAETGEVLCWGDRSYGQLGPQGGQGSAFPVFVPLPDEEKAVSVSSGSHHHCAVTESEKLVCWGRNQGGNSAGVTPEILRPSLFPLLRCPVFWREPLEPCIAARWIGRGGFIAGVRDQRVRSATVGWRRGWSRCRHWCRSGFLSASWRPGRNMGVRSPPPGRFTVGDEMGREISAMAVTGQGPPRSRSPRPDEDPGRLLI